MEKKNRIAQWAFDTRPILGRFHLWLEDVKSEWDRGKNNESTIPKNKFIDDRIERLFIMTAAVTALGTRLFGRYGEGKGVEKSALNQIKKDADAISAYAMSESLWYLSRFLPENHAIMVCLGEGLMPKGGETPEMGSNPMLGFGRIYARPQVAKFLELCVRKLINLEDYTLDVFRREINNAGITVWGTAIDTLENTSRFARGSETGPMTVLHIFDQPLAITEPYEGYFGNLVLPREIVRNAEKKSLLINFLTPRKKVLEAIKITHPEIKNENVHVWTLTGKTREPRIGKLWEEWRKLGVHLVDEYWELPTGYTVFVDSGTYAPTYLVGDWKDLQEEIHLFIVDGYAASAEAIQAASLSEVFDLDISMAIFSSKFKLSYNREYQIMHLDPEAQDFSQQLSEIFKETLDEAKVEQYRDEIKQAGSAGIPIDKRIVTIEDFLPEKKWQVMAFSGYMLPDPYSGIPGIKQVDDSTYEVTARLSSNTIDKRVTFTLRLLEKFEVSQLVFNPILNRFIHGEKYQERAVKMSDSGRIRNELQTLCSEALEHFGTNGIKVHFDKILPNVISSDNQKKLHEILSWYKKNHPIWFSWLELK